MLRILLNSNIFQKKKLTKFKKNIKSVMQQKFYCNSCKGKGNITCTLCTNGCNTCNYCKFLPCPECSGLGFNGYNYSYF